MALWLVNPGVVGPLPNVRNPWLIGGYYSLTNLDDPASRGRIALGFHEFWICFMK